MPDLLISPIQIKAALTIYTHRLEHDAITPAGDPNPDGRWYVWTGTYSTTPGVAAPNVIASHSAANGWSVAVDVDFFMHMIPSPAQALLTPGGAPFEYDVYQGVINVTPPSGWDVNTPFGVAVLTPFHSYYVDTAHSTEFWTESTNWWEDQAGRAQPAMRYEGAFEALTCSFDTFYDGVLTPHVGQPTWVLEAEKRHPIDFLAINNLDFPVSLQTPIEPQVLDAAGWAIATPATLTNFYTAYDGNDYPAAVNARDYDVGAILNPAYASAVGETFVLRREPLVTLAHTIEASFDFDDGTSDSITVTVSDDAIVTHEYTTVQCEHPGYATTGAGWFHPQLTLTDNYGRTHSTPLDAAYFTYWNSAPFFALGPIRIVNHAPMAAAMLCSTNEDSTIHLDGTESTDVDGDPITHQWYLLRLEAFPHNDAISYTRWTDAVTYNGSAWLRVGPATPEATPGEGVPQWFRMDEDNAADLDTSGFTHGAAPVSGTETLLDTGATVDVEPPTDEGPEPPTYVYVFLLRAVDNDGAADWDWACHFLIDAGHPIHSLTDPFGIIYGAIKSGSDIQVIRERGGGYTCRENLFLLEGHKNPSIYRAGSSRLFLLGQSNSTGAWNLYDSDDCGENFTYMAQPFGGDTSYKKVRADGTAEGGGIATAIKAGTVWITHSWDNVNWSTPVDTEIASTTAADVHQQQAAGSSRLVIVASSGTYASDTADGGPHSDDSTSWAALT